MDCADLARIINSDNVQGKLKAIRKSIRAHDKTKKNPLKNSAIMHKINPYAKQARQLLEKREADRKKARVQRLKDKRKAAGKKAKATRTKSARGRDAGLEQSYLDAENLIAEDEKRGNYQPGDSDDGEDEE